MKICIDNRERLYIPKFQEFIKLKKSKFIDDMETNNYQVGDAFTSDGLIGIERKGTDFVSSIYDGQLSKQCKELSDNFSFPLLFLEYEGIMDMVSKNLGTNPDVIIGAISSVIAKYRVSVLFVGDLYISFVFRVIDKFYEKENVAKDISYTPIRRGVTIKERKLDIISRIPNVGPKKGLKLLEAFGYSISNIAKANKEELKKVKGIGDSVANAIKETLK